MIYYGIAKAGKYVINCRPCAVSGNFVKQNDMIVVGTGSVIARDVEDIYIVMIKDEIAEKHKIPISLFNYLLTKNESCDVIRIS